MWLFQTHVLVNLLLVSWIILLLMLAAGALQTCRTKEAPKPKDIRLSDLANLWVPKGSRVIEIGKLSHLWRKNPDTSRPQAVYPDLQHNRAGDFREKYILQAPWFKNAPLQREVCCRILKLLDREGDCPSVVNVAKDVEGSWDPNTFNMLARTNLLDHSLNVAEEMVELLTKAEACHVIPDTMVAVLAHDLGKLPSEKSFLYSMGEHPVASAKRLNEVAGFDVLPRKEEILRAVKLHHKVTDGLLGKTLRKADQQARQKELGETGGQVPPDLEPDERETAPELPAPVQQLPPPPVMPATEIVINRQAWSDIYGAEAESDKDSEVPVLINISRWFDPEAFLRDMKPYINRLEGRSFMAFSMPDGHVYFQAKVLENIARKQAERAGAMEIAAMALGDLGMRRVLYSIVHQLRTEREVIASGLIKDSFFGGYFTLTWKTGRPMQGYYTPFHAEAFGSIAEMEQAKPGLLRGILKVSPQVASSEAENT
ncbi:MAG: HD domain-containing protein [Desulfobulbaceae bacterium]